MNHYFHYYQLLSRWIKLKNSKYAIEKYLTDNNIKSIAIYGASFFGEHLFNELADSTVTISCVIDRDPLADFKYNVGIISDFSLIPTVDAIIVTPFLYFDEISEQLSPYTQAKIISLAKIICNLYPYGTYKDISDFLREKGARLFAIKLAMPDEIKNQTPLESFFIANKEIRVDFDKQMDFLIGMYPHIRNCDAAYINEVATGYYRTCNTSRKVVCFIDRTGEHVNIINGQRFVPSIPEKYESTIHIYGSCYAIGAYADDEHTIANLLQNKLNNVNSFAKGYRVIAHAEQTTNVNEQFELIKSLTFGKNDIIIILTDNSFNSFYFDNRVFYSFDNIRCYEMSEAFNRVRELEKGELFIDYLHVNNRAYQIISDEIYRILFSASDISETKAPSVQFNETESAHSYAPPPPPPDSSRKPKVPCRH